ncbi:hypothetical protein DFH09DRAFT_1404933 [Mycena vulgaris]|nr:hypothetical protein DFH09DRAFT_1404933 [Mycena vulgaris]
MHHGLSDRTRIITVVVCIVVLLLLLACRIARIRQNRRAAAAVTSVLPIATAQAHAPNYASQGLGGYNGYTLPPNYAPQPPYGQPPQGPYAPPGYGGHVGTGGEGAPQHAARHGRQRERAATAVRCLHVRMRPLLSRDQSMIITARWPADAYAPPAGGYAPPFGPPGVYSPPAGYAAAPALPPVSPAHTTGQDHFRAQ